MVRVGLLCRLSERLNETTSGWPALFRALLPIETSPSSSVVGGVELTDGGEMGCASAVVPATKSPSPNSQRCRPGLPSRRYVLTTCLQCALRCTGACGRGGRELDEVKLRVVVEPSFVAALSPPAAASRGST